MVSKTVIVRMKRFVEIARVLKPNNQTGQFFHVTFICHKRKTLAIGINNYHKVNIPNRWGDYLPSKNDGPVRYIAGVHSEISALIKLGLEDCSDLDFYNIRIGNNNQIGMSKPCKNCQRVLKQIGFKNLYYFDENKRICVLN